MFPTKTNERIMLAFSLLLCLISILGLIYMAAETAEVEAQEHLNEGHNKNVEEAKMVTGPRVIEVVLQRHYLDGEVSEETIEERILSMQDFWVEYSGWQLIDQSEDKLVFKKDIDDISPLLKANGYFGVSEDGILTIYKGKPNSEEVIQSFFQLDVDKLESRKQKELQQGIPVRSKDHYKEVLESFEIYSLN